MLSQKNEEKETSSSSIETKQNRLSLDLKILSSLNTKQTESYNNSYLNNSELEKKKNSNSIFSPLKGNFDFEKNIQILNNFNNPLIIGNNYTNLTYYQEPFNYDNLNNNSRNNSVMSYKNTNTFPDLHKTSESYYFNFLQPIKHDTSDFIKQKRTNEFFNYNNNLPFSFDYNNNNVNENIPKNIIQEKNINLKKENKTENKIVLFKTKKGKRINNKNNNDAKNNFKNFNCKHKECEASFITKKLLLSHHKKFNPQCHSDTIFLLELINNTKKIIKNHNLKYLDDLKKKYYNIMKNISLEEHVQLISGLTFD